MHLLGAHAVVVEPVDNRLSSHSQCIGQVFYPCLARVGVLVVRHAQKVFLFLAEEDARLLVAATVATQAVAKGTVVASAALIEAATPLAIGCKEKENI